MKKIKTCSECSFAKTGEIVRYPRPNKRFMIPFQPSFSPPTKKILQSFNSNPYCEIKQRNQTTYNIFCYVGKATDCG